MQRDDPTSAIDHNKKIACCDLRNVMRRILDGHRIGAGHDCARDRKISQQGNIAGQHGFALVTEVLKRSDRVAQVDRDALADVAANAPLHQKQTGGGKASRDQQHRQQEARTEPQARQRGLTEATGETGGTDSGDEVTASTDEFVSHTMYGAEMYRARWIPLQLLAKLENVIVDSPGRRIVLVTPDFVE